MSDVEDRLLAEVRALRSELDLIRSELSKSGYEGLSALGGIRAMAKNEHTLKEIRILIRSYWADPNDIISHIERLFDQTA